MHWLKATWTYIKSRTRLWFAYACLGVGWCWLSGTTNFTWVQLAGFVLLCEGIEQIVRFQLIQAFGKLAKEIRRGQAQYIHNRNPDPNPNLQS